MRSKRRIFADKSGTDLPKVDAKNSQELSESLLAIPSSRSVVLQTEADKSKKDAIKPEPVFQQKLKTERNRSTWQMALGVLVLALLIIFIPLIILRPTNQKYRLATWSMATVGLSEFVDTTSGLGTLTPLRIFDLKSELEGRINRVSIIEGQTVKANQALLRVSNQDFQETELIAQKDFEIAQETMRQSEPLEQTALQEGRLLQQTALTKLEAAKRELQGLEKVFEAGGESRQNVELARERVLAVSRDVLQADLSAKKLLLNAQKTFGDAKNQVERAKARLLATQRKIAQGLVVAPFNGQVTELKVVLGQTVSRGETLLTLIDPDIRNAQLTVDASKADKLRIGQTVRLEVAGKTLTGSISTIGIQAEENKAQSNNTIKLSVKLDKTVTEFRPNTQVTAEIETARRKTVRSTKRGAYLASGGGQFVFVISEDKTKATRRNVLLGDSNGERIEILSGLETNEKILTSSYDSYKEFSEIELAPTGELK